MAVLSAAEKEPVCRDAVTMSLTAESRLERQSEQREMILYYMYH